MMLNPYQSPPEIRQSPWRKRLKRAWSMAVAEYRAGLQRDGFTLRDHVGAWMGLFALAFLLLILLSAIVVGIVLVAGNW